MPPAVTVPSTATPRISPGARTLQDKLHDVLSRLAGTIEHVKNWPESTDTSVHVESTTRLIASIREIIAALQGVESTVRNDAELRSSLQSLLIPLDLLELLDHALNPDCFSRGLLKEAMGQFAGLKRRKWALELLGAAVQKGLDDRLHKEQSEQPVTTKEATGKSERSGVKRESKSIDNEDAEDAKPTSKKPKIEN